MNHDERGAPRARVGVYARVSTIDQDPASQLHDLRRYAEHRGWSIAEEFIDHGISGTKDSRPALNRMMAAARQRRFDVVLVWRFDRFARSTSSGHPAERSAPSARRSIRRRRPGRLCSPSSRPWPSRTVGDPGARSGRPPRAARRASAGPKSQRASTEPKGCWRRVNATATRSHSGRAQSAERTRAQPMRRSPFPIGT